MCLHVDPVLLVKDHPVSSTALLKDRVVVQNVHVGSQVLLVSPSVGLKDRPES